MNLRDHHTDQALAQFSEAAATDFRQELAGCLVQVSVRAPAGQVDIWRQLYEIAWAQALAQVAPVQSSYRCCGLN